MGSAMPPTFPEPEFKRLSRDDETIDRILTVRAKLIEWREVAAVDHFLRQLDEGNADEEYAVWMAQWLETDRGDALAHLLLRMPCPCRDADWFHHQPACNGNASLAIRRALELLAAGDERCRDKLGSNHALRCRRFATVTLAAIAESLAPPPIRPLSHPRDWVAEARCLANGADTMKIERGHLVAVFDLIEERDKVIRELLLAQGRAA